MKIRRRGRHYRCFPMSRDTGLTSCMTKTLVGGQEVVIWANKACLQETTNVACVEEVNARLQKILRRRGA